MPDFARELDELLSIELPQLAPLPPGDYVVYGAGNIGRRVASKLFGRDKKIRAFIDQKGAGNADGLPIYSPYSAEARRFAAEGLTAVVGVFNYAADPHEIRTVLEDLGYRRIVSFPEFHEHAKLPPHFWVDTRRHTLDYHDRIREAGMLMADEKSRRIFLDILRYRLTFDTALLRQPDAEEQYLPADLPQPKMPFRFVDGGAFTGDTIESLLRKGVTFESVAAFEPDEQNFLALCHTARKHAANLGDVSIWPCGLSDATAVAAFCAGRDQASIVAGHGNTHVQLVALDQVLPVFRPNFIKLDIEGAELAALVGAAETIREHQPTLAVCVYHRPDDLWEIPLYMHELLPRHTIALRYHKYYALETVAYAIPPSD
ncbi:MAG TPA: FkbM family methyltransferase [Chthoniobacteraceae bacterium]|nr:FkbM family methyltransferase [Chthoniobacteraceae bacterium]